MFEKKSQVQLWQRRIKERLALLNTASLLCLLPSVLVPIKPFFSPYPKFVVYRMARLFIGELIMCQPKEADNDQGGGDISGFYFFPWLSDKHIYYGHGDLIAQSCTSEKQNYLIIFSSNTMFTFWKLEIWPLNDCVVQSVRLYKNVHELLFTVTVQCHPDWVTVLPSDSKRPENCVGDSDNPPLPASLGSPSKPCWCEEWARRTWSLTGAFSHDWSCTAAVVHHSQDNHILSVSEDGIVPLQTKTSKLCRF